MAEEQDSWTCKRFEARIAVRLPIRVVGLDQKGSVFNERATTRNVSSHGICLELPATVPPGARISVSLANSQKKFCVVTFEVQWVLIDKGVVVHGGRLVTNGDWQNILTELHILPEN